MVASSTTNCRCCYSGSVVLDRVISYVCFCHCVLKKKVVVCLQINLIIVYTVINNHRIYVFMKICLLVYQLLTIFFLLKIYWLFSPRGCIFYSESKCDRNKMICIINKFNFQPLPDTFTFFTEILLYIYHNIYNFCLAFALRFGNVLKKVFKTAWNFTAGLFMIM